MRLIFVASDPMEFRGIAARAAEKRKCRIGVNWALTARLRGSQVLLVANGVGAKRAAAAVDAAHNVFPAEAVVSTGFCGALDPRLAIGDAVVATCVVAQSARYPALSFPSAGRATTGVLISTDHVVGTAAEKRALHDTGAAVVEMEASGVAARAQALGLPFFCARAVSDLATEDMKTDFNAVLRSDGQFDTIGIFRQLLRRPLSRLPELIRLRQNCTRAAESLGDFFADCGF